MAFRTFKCVGSGMCCQRGPCQFGESISDKEPGCRFLEIKEVVNGVTIYKCGKYEEIVKQPFSDFNPAFGAGCCQSLFNENRQKILALVEKGMPLPHG